ncbi:response regulator [Desulfosarcina sp.]|uniref:response regulator n=1 Tax=Desulfosarcina sp. TaxID=2027861 RepID=UPI0029B0FCB4|nr:response regulator [Desulfosarcina sp.]MDX2452861.1 response regulator [Desulfosarcina sp.]MDX2490605.1 response regulator [Desulfosarcina sp.]
MNATKTVLVIDDEAATLTMFRLFLNAYRYSVLTAENGETGLRLVREHHPGIVFTDLKIPGMDGFEVLRQIKKTLRRRGDRDYRPCEKTKRWWHLFLCMGPKTNLRIRTRISIQTLSVSVIQ